MPGGRLFIGLGNAQQLGLIMASAQKLHADGHFLRGKPAGKGNGRKAGEISRAGEAQKDTPDRLLLARDPNLLFGKGRGNDGQGRGDQGVHFFKNLRKGSRNFPALFLGLEIDHRGLIHAFLHALAEVGAVILGMPTEAVPVESQGFGHGNFRYQPGRLLNSL